MARTVISIESDTFSSRRLEPIKFSDCNDLSQVVTLPCQLSEVPSQPSSLGMFHFSHTAHTTVILIKINRRSVQLNGMRGWFSESEAFAQMNSARFYEKI